MAKCNRKQRLLGKSIRRIRMRRNMTQRELANAAGLGESAFRSYELGERSPKQNTLERIAKALDVAPACFDTYGIEHYDELICHCYSAYCFLPFFQNTRFSQCCLLYHRLFNNLK